MINRLFVRFFQSTLFFGVMALLTPTAFAIDEPHDSRDGGVTPMNCDDCHVLHTATYPAPVASLLDTLCQSCHFTGGPAPAVVTHSSRTTDAGYGNWDLDCWACHNPHKQYQDRTWRNPAWFPGDARPPLGKFVKRSFQSVPIKIINPMMYLGPETGTYTLRVTTAGGSGVAVLTCTSTFTDNLCNSTPYGWTDDTPISIGTYAATITITDTSPPAELALDDTWEIPVTAGTPTGTVGSASCITSGCNDDDAVSGSDPGYYWPYDSIDRTVSSDIIQLLFSGGSPEPPDPTKMFVDAPPDGGTTGGADDICQVCHVNTSNYNTGGKLDTHSNAGTDSQPGGNCMACHVHDKGFSPQGADCTSCHANVQGAGNPPNSGTDYRRQVTSTGGDFERLSHHVTDGTTTQIIAQEDCEVCHNQNNHQKNADPWVLLNNADGDPVVTAGSFIVGTTYTIDTTGTTDFTAIGAANSDPGTVFTATGSGSGDGTAIAHITYNGTGASVEAFCLSCHDSNGANGDTTPFPSDNNSPPNIASTWVSSSHDNNLTAQACLSCHGGADSTRTGAITYDQNMHGSSKVKMLSPKVANEDLSAFTFATTGTGASARTDKEELCYACHDPDGPAIYKDIESRFKTATDYHALGDAGALVNQRHDVLSADQTYSGGVVECSNCHNPHMATTASKTITPDTPTQAFSQNYSKLNSYGGVNYYSRTTNLDPINPQGASTMPNKSISPAVRIKGNDLAISEGTYTGTVNQTYRVTVTTAGGPGAAQITVTSTAGNDSGPTTVTLFNSPIDLGNPTQGVKVRFIDSGTPVAVGTPAGGGAGFTGISGGTYFGPTGTYTFLVTTTGGPGSGKFRCTSNIAGDVCTTVAEGGTEYTWVTDNTLIDIGSYGAQFGIDDTAGKSEITAGLQWTVSVSEPTGGDGLVEGDGWTIDANINCKNLPVADSCSERDSVAFCLACHDGTTPAGVTMSPNMLNIASDGNGWVDTGTGSQHGNGDGSTSPASNSFGGNGPMKKPWSTNGTSDPTENYAALPCTTCHDAHGSPNIYHLRESIKVAGQQLTVGGTTVFTNKKGTVYKLPVVGGSQNIRNWGAWCTFCHAMTGHPSVDESSTCQSAHVHGGSNF